MAAAPSVKTVQFTDPRIEPQADPVYEYVVAPTQNQYYKIAASSLSNSQITFNNLTTLGVDRAYLDTFELELRCTFTFDIETNESDDLIVCPAPDEWTFDSFPFNKCCEEAHVNINGGAFFSQPLSYVRAKERYMDQHALSNCYENVCPIHRPIGQYESGDNYTGTVDAYDRLMHYLDGYYDGENYFCEARPTRYGVGMRGYMQSECGMAGGFNNSILDLGEVLRGTWIHGGVTEGNIQYGRTNYHFGLKTDPVTHQPVIDNSKMIITATWREPIFCSPFSSRYDATYGRPLYNITSMDLTFTMQDLGNMIRLMHLRYPGTYVKSYNVNIDSAMLCYQVMTIPPIMKKPLTTLVPYRRFIPYITDYAPNSGASPIDPTKYSRVEMSSGVYTMNEVPTAIWVFLAPSKAIYQQNLKDTCDGADDSLLINGNWDTNKLFAKLNRISITMANTTQILNTAQPYDLYRIAKANGCEDSYVAWSGGNTINPRGILDYMFAESNYAFQPLYSNSVGSVLRLKPGVDLIVPDQALIPGANANNMVFQVSGEWIVPPHSPVQNTYSLWLLFEYVGVASISPGQCEITMNPLGSGEIMAASPIISATSAATEGKLAGSGVWDTIRRNLEIAQHVAKENGIIPKIIKNLPNQSEINGWLGKQVMTGGPGSIGPGAKKRPRGGAVIGKGLQDWSV